MNVTPPGDDQQHESLPPFAQMPRLTIEEVGRLWRLACWYRDWIVAMEKAGASPGEIANFRELRGFIDLGIQAWTRLEGVQDLITAQPGDYWENLGQLVRKGARALESSEN